LLGAGAEVPADDVHGRSLFRQSVGASELEPGDGLLEGGQEGYNGDVVTQHRGAVVRSRYVNVAGVDVDVGEAVELAALVLVVRADAGDHVDKREVAVEAVGCGQELVVAD
jgi:hypothetical protein